MKTKQKKDESKLYDFDYESKEEKKLKAKRKKAVKKSASKEAKKEANGKHGQVPEKKRYEDEIIIGVTRYPEKKQTNNQKNTSASLHHLIQADMVQLFFWSYFQETASWHSNSYYYLVVP